MAETLDVVFFEAFEEEAEEIRKCLGSGSEIRAVFTAMTVQESSFAKRASSPAALISVRTQSHIPAQWARAGLRAILTRSTGYDHMVEYRQQCGVSLPMAYLPVYCARSVAEHALLSILCLLRKLSVQQKNFHRFSRDGMTGSECLDKTLLVVGVGNIGKEMCRIGAGIGMRVLGVDTPAMSGEVPAGCTMVEPEEGMAAADIIVCAMNLTEANRNYFSYAKFAQSREAQVEGDTHTRPSPVFVNIARGELSPSADLLRCLEDGLLRGVALDVYEKEKELATGLRLKGLVGKAPPASPCVAATLKLSQRDDVLCTPHNAFNTREAVMNKSVQAVKQYLQHGVFPHPIPGSDE